MSQPPVTDKKEQVVSSVTDKNWQVVTGVTDNLLLFFRISFLGIIGVQFPMVVLQKCVHSVFCMFTVCLRMYISYICRMYKMVHVLHFVLHL